ncbi:MAG: hypothetical protein JOZ24_02485, partial [Candidatus Eremiobacteraeota bacterium]|nr:hypothetical protein [Candidatus Eremiobacteraeota bacterium]
PGIIYGGKVTRYDERTHEARDVGPELGWRAGTPYRFRRTAPLAFSPVDHRTLYLGADVVLRTRDYGDHWTAISPDLLAPADARSAQPRNLRRRR